ncbi:precorrin-6y C5,15-methyltransferase (decarboxylating) subunit CbiE [Pseudonocardia sp. CA-107938]|uniref:precorrin-6y C5,15-methyltransferase (decarboxylating) subunit CbiE n=1 Tax=Pseudonocardia sp. CA-107938 TaxID=3240021 RepID=UPI003D8A80EF
MTDEPVIVVGIGADGWAGLTDAARAAIVDAEVVLGGRRQLDLVAGRTTAEPVAWPSPMLPRLAGFLDGFAGRRVVALASGDPMLHGLGGTLVRVLGADRVTVLGHPSSVSLACARLGWAVEDVEIVTVVGRPLDRLRRVLAGGRRIIVLSAGAGTPAEIAALLVDAGFGASEMTVLEQLGGPAERRVDGTAEKWAEPVDPLNLVALVCRGDSGLGETPGLPDDAYAHDGQLTKREVRAVTLAHLAPRPGELLWDVGAGCGSIGIEWMRAHPACAAVAIEQDAERAARISTNAAALGVPGLRVVVGRAPETLSGLPEPDVVFVGGGLTRDGVLPACLAALRPGGRLVANAVTVETEAVLAAAHTAHGGQLVRMSVARSGPLGEFTGWRPAMPVTIWSTTVP